MLSNHDTPTHIMTLMEQSGVAFGTSGVRGLVKDMTDLVCYTYVTAFIQHLEALAELQPLQPIGIALDFRVSSPRIATACCQAIMDKGYIPINGGNVPTPAIALYGIAHNIPTLMVTGSHIPDDRNGIKFYRSCGEILKSDEKSIQSITVDIPHERFDDHGQLIHPPKLPPTDNIIHQEYIARYTNLFPENALNGMRIAVYQHSSVASRSLLELLTKLGAEVIPLGYSEAFIPVDTEAVRQEDISLAKTWAQTHSYDAIASTDGDGDRPFIGDENGTWLRGDIIGILCAHYLSAGIVVTPISSNSAVEKSGYFRKVIRTRIGSPYVIEAMQAQATEQQTVVGYEANGGFLTQTPITISGANLSPLPTRDALLPILVTLHMCVTRQCSLSQLLDELPARFTCSDRIKGIPTAVSHEKLKALQDTKAEAFLSALHTHLGNALGKIQSMDTTDGLRMTLNNGHIVHLRPSGNAPELRCYTEADTKESAQQLNLACINIMHEWQ